MYKQDLFNLEIEFAEQAAKLEPTSIDNALLKYTSFYGALFVPSQEKDPNQELWLSFLNYIKGGDLKTSAYEFYINRTKERGRYAEKKEYSGKPCFIHMVIHDQAYFHFNNNEGAEPGPLSKVSMPVRIQEIKDILKTIHEKNPEVTTMNGYSWLYNIPSYARLFPPAFIESGVQVKDDFSFNIYGQFLNSSDEIKSDVANQFLENVHNSTTYDQLINAFPLYPIKVSAPIEVFDEFYGINT